MKWILLFIYLLMILGVIFLERKQPTEALLWVVVLVCLPYLGAVLYLVFGSTMAIKLTAYLRKKRLDEHHLSIHPAANCPPRACRIRRGPPGHPI